MGCQTVGRKDYSETMKVEEPDWLVDSEDGETPRCPNPLHKKSAVVRNGTITLANGSLNQRYLCTTKVGGRNETHSFSDNSEKVSTPQFSQIVCPTHGKKSRVIFAGSYSQGGVNRQRYKCYPRNKDKDHEFTPPLPRTKVDADEDWRNADVVINPNRGKLASGRGHTADIPTVVEGLRMLANGRTYADVGRYAEKSRPKRKRRGEKKHEEAVKKAKEEGKPPPPPITFDKKNGADYWQTGADWCELYAPVLWDNWLTEIAENPPAPNTPRIVVMDDLPFFGGKQNKVKEHAKAIFSVLVVVEYFQTHPEQTTFDHRVRLIRALPKHTADAYELLLLELGYTPDVIVSDSSTSIEALLRRLRSRQPVVWIPSAFHVVKQLRKALLKMSSAKTGRLANPGTLMSKLESYQLLDSPQSWQDWWDDFDAKTQAQQVAPGLLPTVWRRKYQQAVADALVFVANNPNTPKGNGAVEATIRGAVKPFFEGRATTMGNINRTNNLCDLLCLSQNQKMDNPKEIAKLLVKDLADDNNGYAPPARQIADPEGTRSLREAGVVLTSLAAAKREHT